MGSHAGKRNAIRNVCWKRIEKCQSGTYSPTTEIMCPEMADGLNEKTMSRLGTELKISG